MKVVLIVWLAAMPAVGWAETVEARLARLEREVVALRAALAKASPRIDYAAQDQSDTLAITAEEVEADRAVDQAEAASHRVRYAKLQEGYTSGSISERTMRQMELELALDPLRADALANREKSIREKRASLSALRESDMPGFTEWDLATNRSQLAWYEAERKKAELGAKYAKDYYERFHALYLKGAGPWATDHHLEVEAEKARRQAAGWSRKCEAQRRQVAAAEAEYAKWHKP